MKRFLQAWLLCVFIAPACFASEPNPLLFYLSGDNGTTADYSAGGTPVPNFDYQVTSIPDGALGKALRCGDLQRLAWWAPGNIYAQRGTLSFFWRPHTAVGPTPFPIFRVGYADHSSWDMVFLRIDYNGHGFDAFVTDASLARTRVSVTIDPFPSPDTWIHLALAWDETQGIRFYLDGLLKAEVKTKAVYDAALDEFGPHSRIISPHNVQSDFNFVRGGDIDEIRIYSKMMPDALIHDLANKQATVAAGPIGEPFDPQEWALKYGWNRPESVPALPEGRYVSIRKVEIHDAYDLKRWYWKACDGIRETTWPGVYNRSRLPGRNDYFQLPDWDCYSLSGKSITFTLPDEPWNHLEISGAAFGTMTLLANPAGGGPKQDTVLFERPQGQERTVHALGTVLGQKIRFDNVRQEEPISELAAYYVSEGKTPAGSSSVRYLISGDYGQSTDDLKELKTFIAGRFQPGERSVAIGFHGTLEGLLPAPAHSSHPILHVLIPNHAPQGGDLDQIDGGLDGIEVNLPGFTMKPAQGGRIFLNIQVKDPLWPLRDMFDFTFSVKPNDPKTLWLDLRDRILPPGKSVWLTIAASGADFDPSAFSPPNPGIRLVFKPKAQARVEHEIDRFTQAKDAYAMLVEEHPFSDKLHLWTRFKADINDLLRVNPNHYPGRNYWAAAMPGSPRPPYTEPQPPAGVPKWAFLQAECLRHVEYFSTWWVLNRQVENGEFGGGLSDDTDLSNTWPGVALMGIQPELFSDSLIREVDACYRQQMITNGLCSIQADELHGYEEGLNALGQNMILNFGSPRMLERAMETSKALEWLTGFNSAGHRLFKSSYYNGLKMATDSVWGYTKSYSYLVTQPQQLLVDFNGNPRAQKTAIELADGLLAHRHQDATGKYVLPGAIHFVDDKEATSVRSYFPWPLFWTAYSWTRDPKYLDPIYDGGTGYVMGVNADILDRLNLRSTWGPRIEGNEKVTLGESRKPDARRSRPDPTRSTTKEFFLWQLTGDKRHLESIYSSQLESMVTTEYIETEGSLWIDRVNVPTAELQRSRLGGVALIRNSPFPGHEVSWRFRSPASAESVALLIPTATPTSFKVIAYNLETNPVTAQMTGWGVDPGRWEITQGIAEDNGDTVTKAGKTRTERFERSRSLWVTFPPRTTTILTCTLKQPGKPYWQRGDLGIDPEDVQVRGREVIVMVHSLGSVPSEPTTVVFRDNAGRTVCTEDIPSIEAPNDLTPRVREVRMTLPDGTVASGGTVEIDPDQASEEITRLNNVVHLKS